MWNFFKNLVESCRSCLAVFADTVMTWVMEIGCSSDQCCCISRYTCYTYSCKVVWLIDNELQMTRKEFHRIRTRTTLAHHKPGNMTTCRCVHAGDVVASSSVASVCLSECWHSACAGHTKVGTDVVHSSANKMRLKVNVTWWWNVMVACYPISLSLLQLPGYQSDAGDCISVWLYVFIIVNREREMRRLLSGAVCQLMSAIVLLRFYHCI